MACVICKNKILKSVFSVKNLPIYMGAVEKQNYEFSDLTFSYCENCLIPQIEHQIDIAKIYCKNHNVDIVGRIWSEHYDAFANFCLQEFKDKDILEIGDPAAKLAKKIHQHVKNWDIIEPNSCIQNFMNIRYINDFFSEPTDKKYDCIVSSHVFEHVNPVEHLNLCYDSLQENGMLFISIPDMRFFLHNFVNPVLLLNFEHTYYIDEKVLNYLFKISGFEKCEIVYFRNHSLFISAKKNPKKYKVDLGNSDIFQKFESLIQGFEKYINEIKMKDLQDSFIYGCHVTSQCLLTLGIKSNRLLDNSINKNNLYLYGTNLKSELPEIIKDFKSPKIITSHTGIYRAEIEKQLLEINPTSNLF